MTIDANGVIRWTLAIDTADKMPRSCRCRRSCRAAILMWKYFLSAKSEGCVTYEIACLDRSAASPVARICLDLYRDYLLGIRAEGSVGRTSRGRGDSRCFRTLDGLADG